MALSIFEYSNYRLFLKEVFAERKQHFKGFSHRYIAQKTKTSVGYFSQICQGRSNASSEKAKLIADVFQLLGKEKEYFLTMVDENQTTNQDQKQHSLLKMRKLRSDRVLVLQEDQFEYYLDWYHCAIRELVHILDDQENTALIAKTLNPNISEKEVKESLQLLISLGLLERGENQRLQRTERVLHSKQPQALSKALQDYVAIFTDLGKRAIVDMPSSDRFASSMVFGVSSKGEDKIKDILLETQQKIIDVVLNDRDIDRVMDVNLHLFPLTHKEKDD